MHTLNRLSHWLKRWRYGNQYGYEVFFKSQEFISVGKTGIILADMGMPEDFDPLFYTNFMDHVFAYSLPAFLRPLVLMDRGIALIDPSNPLARESFKPVHLVDMYGSSVTRDGRPYTDCQVSWQGPGMKKNPSDHGYFIYKGDGKTGIPEVCQKTAAKVGGWYYGHLLPEKKVAWAYQCRKIYEEASEALLEKYSDVVIRHARYMVKDTIAKAVEDLKAEGCKTIVYHNYSSPVYSDFEDYSLAMPIVHRAAESSSKVIFADQTGNQLFMRQAYVMMALDRLAELPDEASVMLILSKHGHPFKKETQDRRAHLFREPLERDMRDVMNKWKGRWEIVWSQDEYADEYWDPGNRKFSTYTAYRKAITGGFDYALEIPTDFIAENTDLMFFHAIKKFKAFSDYDPFAPIPYPDWEKPLIRTFREGKTTGIYAGCPVGTYRQYVVKAVVNSISEVLENRVEQE